MKLDLKNYPGSKGGNGVYQWIINNIPYHEYFIEMFTGSGVVTEKILPHDNNETVYYLWEKYKPVSQDLELKFKGERQVIIQSYDSVEWYSEKLKTDAIFDNELFFYADPPYLKNTRVNKRNLYGCEWNVDDHVQFLETMLELNKRGCLIMISHYDSSLYNEYLKGWKTDTFETMTRGGKATEKIYMNYDVSKQNLAVTAYLGKNYSDRQRIKRRKISYLKKFNDMDLHERQAVLEYIQKYL